MQTLEDFFAGIGAELSCVREARLLADQRESPSFSVFRYLKPDENLLSDILADLLDPNGAHGQGTTFLAEFLQVAGFTIQPSLDQARVCREVITNFLAQPRRIDFTLEIG